MTPRRRAEIVEQSRLMEQFYQETGTGALTHWSEYVAWKKQQKRKQ